MLSPQNEAAILSAPCLDKLIFPDIAQTVFEGGFNQVAISTPSGTNVEERGATPLMYAQITRHIINKSERMLSVNLGNYSKIPLIYDGRSASLLLSNAELMQTTDDFNGTILSRCSRVGVEQDGKYSQVCVPNIDIIGHDEEGNPHVALSVARPGEVHSLHVISKKWTESPEALQKTVDIYRYLVETVATANLLNIKDSDPKNSTDLFLEIAGSHDETYRTLSDFNNSDVLHAIKNAIGSMRLYFELFNKPKGIEKTPRQLIALLNSTIGLNNYLENVIPFCGDGFLDITHVVEGGIALSRGIRTESECGVSYEIKTDEVFIPAQIALHISELVGNSMVNGAQSVLVEVNQGTSNEFGDAINITVHNDNTVVPLEDGNLGHIFENGYTNRPKNAVRGGGFGLYSLDSYMKGIGGGITVTTSDGRNAHWHTRNHTQMETTVANGNSELKPSYSHTGTSFSLVLPRSR